MKLPSIKIQAMLSKAKKLFRTLFLHSPKRTFFVVGGLIVMLALPITVLLTQQSQDNRQRADTFHTIRASSDHRPDFVCDGPNKINYLNSGSGQSVFVVSCLDSSFNVYIDNQMYKHSFCYIPSDGYAYCATSPAPSLPAPQLSCSDVNGVGNYSCTTQGACPAPNTWTGGSGTNCSDFPGNGCCRAYNCYNIDCQPGTTCIEKYSGANEGMCITPKSLRDSAYCGSPAGPNSLACAGECYNYSCVSGVNVGMPSVPPAQPSVAPPTTFSSCGGDPNNICKNCGGKRSYAGPRCGGYDSSSPNHTLGCLKTNPTAIYQEVYNCISADSSGRNYDTINVPTANSTCGSEFWCGSSAAVPPVPPVAAPPAAPPPAAAPPLAATPDTCPASLGGSCKPLSVFGTSTGCPGGTWIGMGGTCTTSGGSCMKCQAGAGKGFAEPCTKFPNDPIVKDNCTYGLVCETVPYSGDICQSKCGNIACEAPQTCTNVTRDMNTGVVGWMCYAPRVAAPPPVYVPPVAQPPNPPSIPAITSQAFDYNGGKDHCVSTLKQCNSALNESAVGDSDCSGYLGKSARVCRTSGYPPVTATLLSACSTLTPDGYVRYCIPNGREKPTGWTPVTSGDSACTLFNGNSSKCYKSSFLANASTQNGTNCPNRIKGDFNCNGTIGLDDLLVWRDQYISISGTVSGSNTLSTNSADVVAPSGVGFEDLFIWRDNYIKQ